jgi:glyoxylase-like metal-dependent hydrolase (beta-lactamase superfamily II)
MAIRYVGDDLVRIKGEYFDSFKQETRTRVVKTLYWGDEIDLVDPDEAADEEVRDVRVNYYDYPSGEMRVGTVRKRRKNKENIPLTLIPKAQRPLAFEVVDVQQGDASFIRTPKGRYILVDGGEEVFVARLLASVFPGTTAENPLMLDALVVSHGDADHFEGLAALADASEHSEERKRIHVRIARCFHNGLVKSPEKITDEGGEKISLKERERFGEVVKIDKEYYVTDLYDDPREAPHPNGPFTRWGEALDSMLVTDPDEFPDLVATDDDDFPVLARLVAGDDTAFGTFEDDGLSIRVLSPVEEIIEDPEEKLALQILRDEDGRQSASHTINGHSVILQVQYNKVRFLLGGDLNKHGAEKVLTHVAAQPNLSLRSEILKVPHHGSHEFSNEFLEKVAPVISLVSSGDENRAKEYVHPRANLMAAVGKWSRGPEPLVFATELAAFFTFRGGIQPEVHEEEEGELVDIAESKQRGFFFAFERLVFGAVHIRTDGERVFVAPESASDTIKEAYAFVIDDESQINTDEVTII